MVTQDGEYIPSKDEKDNDDDENSNYWFMANDQGDKVTDSSFDDSMTYNELHCNLNELMDDFHKVLTNYFFILKEKLDLIEENFMS